MGFGCTLLDYNRDGSLDLFVANYPSTSSPTSSVDAPRHSSLLDCVWFHLLPGYFPREAPLCCEISHCANVGIQRNLLLLRHIP